MTHSWTDRQKRCWAGDPCLCSHRTITAEEASSVHRTRYSATTTPTDMKASIGASGAQKLPGVPSKKSVSHGDGEDK